MLECQKNKKGKGKSANVYGGCIFQMVVYIHLTSATAEETGSDLLIEIKQEVFIKIKHDQFVMTYSTKHSWQTMWAFKLSLWPSVTHHLRKMSWGKYPWQVNQTKNEEKNKSAQIKMKMRCMHSCFYKQKSKGQSKINIHTDEQANGPKLKHDKAKQL